jgi:hypothetical protein
MSWCSDAPEDEAISLFAGLLANPDVRLSQSLNEAAADKIRKYCADYNNNPNAISFMPAIASTSGRLHSEFIRILFLQAHRETDRFLQLQEFSQRNQIWELSSTFTVRLSLRYLNHVSHRFSPRRQLYVLI